jgi:predicted O-methyltransferase YrrM
MNCIEYRLAYETGKIDRKNRPRPSLDAWRSVQGWCSEHEAGALQQIAAGKTVLEVGVWNGRSTIALAATAEHVFAIDHFYGDEYAGRGNPGARTWEAIVNAEARERITLMTGDWQDIFAYLDIGKFDVIYYDADHTYEATRNFLDVASVTNAIIAIHDYDNNPNHAGAKRAVNELFKVVRVVDRLAICNENERNL